MIKRGDVVQFTEGHKWIGCLGIVNEVKSEKHPRRYMVGVPIPEKGTAYIFDDGSGIELVGRAILAPKWEDDEDEC